MSSIKTSKNFGSFMPVILFRIWGIWWGLVKTYEGLYILETNN